MKREIMYTTKQNVRNILEAKAGAQPATVWLLGMVERQTDRKLLGFIPLPDRYAWSVVTVEGHDDIDGPKADIEAKDGLTFDSYKRLSEARLVMERQLRDKCKEYKEHDKQYGRCW